MENTQNVRAYGKDDHRQVYHGRQLMEKTEMMKRFEQETGSEAIDAWNRMA